MVRLFWYTEIPFDIDNNFFPVIIDAKWDNIGKINVVFKYHKKYDDSIQYFELNYCYIQDQNTNKKIENLAYKSQWKTTNIPYSTNMDYFICKTILSDKDDIIYNTNNNKKKKN